MVFDLCEELVVQHQDANDFEAFKFDVIRFLSTDTQISAEAFKNNKAAALSHSLYEEVTEVYKRKMQYLSDTITPVIKDVYQNRGETIENIVVPFTDGIRGMQVVTNLKKHMNPTAAKSSNHLSVASPFLSLMMPGKKTCASSTT